jgi:hypothetical protein
VRLLLTSQGQAADLNLKISNKNSNHNDASVSLPHIADFPTLVIHYTRSLKRVVVNLAQRPRDKRSITYVKK